VATVVVFRFVLEWKEPVDQPPVKVVKQLRSTSQDTP